MPRTREKNEAALSKVRLMISNRDSTADEDTFSGRFDVLETEFVKLALVTVIYLDLLCSFGGGNESLKLSTEIAGEHGNFKNSIFSTCL